MPSRGTLTVEAFISALDSLKSFRTILLICSRRPVDQARNELASNALRIAKNAPLAMETLVFWFDDDAAWEPASLERAVEYMEKFPEIDLLAGNFCARSKSAVSWHWPRFDASNPGSKTSISPALVEIQACGFHWCLHRPAILERVGPNPFDCFDGLSEDLAFCKQARDQGVRMFAAEDILIGHVDADRGLMYLPDRAPIPLPGELKPTARAWNRRSYGVAQDAERLKYPPANDEFDDAAVISVKRNPISPKEANKERDARIPLVVRLGLPGQEISRSSILKTASS